MNIHGSDAACIIVEQRLNKLASYTAARLPSFHGFRIENLFFGDLFHVSLDFGGDNLLPQMSLDDRFDHSHI